ncbi:ferredoxin [Candidatus Bathyarchaeota archaeon]|nr:MAG: ferredoxin [Candidatus Bathyarchaeota archaeon]
MSRPSEGALGLTGSWRTFRPVIDRDRCVKCLVCWLFCPESAIGIDEEGGPVINYDYCKGCGICASECRYGAIEMVREGEVVA